MIDVVDQQMAQLHKIDQATDRKTACTGRSVLDTGVTENGALSLGVSRKDGVNNVVGREIRGNEQGRKHKIVSVSNANSKLCNCTTQDGSTPEGL